MILTVMLLGLMPMLFLSDIFPDGGNEEDQGEEFLANGMAKADPFDWYGPRPEDEEDDKDDGADEALERSLIVDDSFMLPTDGNGKDGEPLLPDTRDDDSDENSGVDPDTALLPDTGDDDPPDEADPVEGDVLDPNDSPDEEYPIDGDGSLLQRLLHDQTDATTGIGFLGTRIIGTDDFTLGAGDDTLVLDDENAGEGSLSLWDGTPLIDTAGSAPTVVDAGAGDDVIACGDGAAYVFGGLGEDTLFAGNGVAALFGGDGSDEIFGSNTVDPDGYANAYLDGGAGDDTITGGAAHEIIEGGVHVSGTHEADNDSIDGGGGNDIIRGGFGADTLSGGDGDDVIDHLGRAEERVTAERHEFGWHIDNEADFLDGGAGNDTLIIDRADTARGGAGSDTFWLYFDQATGSGHAEITDFEIGLDFLRIELNPEVVRGEPVLEVAPSEDGADGIVKIDGIIVAVLRGAPQATAADIFVEIREDVFR
jgi:Ca2+-binding RTX toxin-like protein